MSKKLATAGSYQRQDIDERFAKWVRVMPDGCHIWTGAVNKTGYPIFGVTIATGKHGNRYAHDWAYERYVGPVPEGYDLDHTCHTRAVERGECAGGDTCLHRRCVNYAEHLEPVTRAENIARSNHITKLYATRDACGEGHVYTEASTYVTAKGWRQCRICAATRARAYKRARRDAARLVADPASAPHIS